MKKIVSLLLCLTFFPSLLCGCVSSALSPQSTPAINTAAATAALAQPEVTAAPAAAYAYISALELHTLLQEGQAPLLLDLQPEAYYKNSHLSGALSTQAYPANDGELLAKLEAVLSEVESASSVVLIDMGGKAGAQNAFDYFVSLGVDPQKLLILEGGMVAWSYPSDAETDPGEYSFGYMSAKETRSALRHNEPLLLLDLRANAEYAASHIKQSVNVEAFLPNADEQVILSSLSAGIDLVLSSGAPKILLITASGGEDAQTAYDFYVRHGAAPESLYILKDGISAWPEDYSHYLQSSDIPVLQQDLLANPPLEAVESTPHLEDASIDPSQKTDAQTEQPEIMG